MRKGGCGGQHMRERDGFTKDTCVHVHMHV